MYKKIIQGARLFFSFYLIIYAIRVSLIKEPTNKDIANIIGLTALMVCINNSILEKLEEKLLAK